MIKPMMYVAAALLLASAALNAHATTYQFDLAGPGVNGTIELTYGAATDARYNQAFEVTGISGSFSDATAGISNASITGLEALNRSSPEPTNLLAPNDFSRFAVASGIGEGGLTYDNLFYPDGSPQTATDYPFFGGITDIYGLLFDIGGGRVVDLWSNGLTPGNLADDYGVAVATRSVGLDYVPGGVAVTPEPGTLCLLGTGAVAAILRRRPAFLRR